jgi:ATP-dependent DNA helicase RecQ
MHDGLWEALRMLRREMAQQQGVPPYVIFHDSTLKAIAEQQPRSLEELAHISGVGARKLERYGAQILERICTVVEAGMPPPVTNRTDESPPSFLERPGNSAS